MGKNVYILLWVLILYILSSGLDIVVLFYLGSNLCFFLFLRFFQKFIKYILAGKKKYTTNLRNLWFLAPYMSHILKTCFTLTFVVTAVFCTLSASSWVFQTSCLKFEILMLAGYNIRVILRLEKCLVESQKAACLIFPGQSSWWI